MEKALRVSDEERDTFLVELFGDAGGAVQGQALAAAWASHISRDYAGAIWSCWRIPSGCSGFLVPEGYNGLALDTQVQGHSLISDEALGIAVTLLAFRDLAGESAGDDVSGLRQRYRELADYAIHRPDASLILELAG